MVTLFLMAIIGYWAVTSIQSGSSFALNQKIQQLQKDNADLIKQVSELTDQIEASQVKITKTETATKVEPIPEPKAAPTPVTTTKKTQTTYKNQSLIDELQKLVTDNISMKLKSQGTRVGTIQKFLNIYNKTSNKIDNDYGASTQKVIIAFQKDQGLSASGEVGPNTYTKMIAWLKKQG